MPLIITPTTDENIVLTDVTTNDVSTSKHGFAPKGSSNAFDFLNGNGAWKQPINYQLRVYSLLGSVVVGESVAGTIVNANSSNALTDGRAIFYAVYLPQSATLNGVKWFQVVQGAYTADNYNGVGLYTYSAGTLTLVASSTDDGNIWKAAANTFSNKAFSSTYVAAAGLYFVGVLYNTSAQTTAPTIGITQSPSNAALMAADFTNSAKVSGHVNSQTALPTPQLMSGLTGAALNWWFGLY